MNDSLTMCRLLRTIEISHNHGLQCWCCPGPVQGDIGERMEEAWHPFLQLQGRGKLLPNTSEKLSHLEMDMAGQAAGPTSQEQKSFQDSKFKISKDIAYPCSVKYVGSGSFPWLSTFHLMSLITSFHWIISFALTSCLLQIPCDSIRATQDNHSILKSSWSQDVQNPFCQARAVTENWGLRKPYSANHMENLKGPNVKQTCCEVKQKCSHESSYHGAKNISRWQQLGLIITQPTVRPGAETLTSVI